MYLLVGVVRLELTRLSTLASKTSVATNYTIPPTSGAGCVNRTHSIFRRRITNPLQSHSAQAGVKLFTLSSNLFSFRDICINNYMKVCPKCQSQHTKSGVYCSRSCANSRGPRTEEFKTKIRNKLRINFNNCIICGNLTVGRRKTCSKQCLHAHQKTCKPPLTPGGYRKGAGRGKHGWYQNFYLDSNYELAYLIYCLDHNINIERNKTFFIYLDENNQERKYYPDFRVNGKLTEIKGFYVKDLNAKINSVTEPIDVLFPKDLTQIFEYVENKTNLKINQLYQLYE